MKNKGLAVFSSPKKSIDFIFRLSAEFSSKVKHPGLVILLNEKEQLKGLVTDGDFRKAYSKNLNFELPIETIMVKNPITFPEGLSKKELIKQIYNKIEDSNKSSGWLRNIVILNANQKVVNIIDFFELVKDFDKLEYKVNIFGMGYVGLMTASLASKGHEVLGLDLNSQIIKKLNLCEPHMFEPGLKETLRNCLQNKK